MRPTAHRERIGEQVASLCVSPGQRSLPEFEQQRQDVGRVHNKPFGASIGQNTCHRVAEMSNGVKLRPNKKEDLPHECDQFISGAALTFVERQIRKSPMLYAQL